MKRIKWFARGGGIAKSGPYETQVDASVAMELVGGGKPDGFATWPEVVIIRKRSKKKKP